MFKAKRSRQPGPSWRLVDPEEGFNVVRLGINYTHWRDLYHLLLVMSWPRFLALIGFLYFAANTLFAWLYLLGRDDIAHAQSGSFVDAFFFSVQTMASIGYGEMYPQTLYANLIVTLESISGILGVAMATGLVFARFSRPTAKVLFSNVAIVTLENGVPSLMFRAANRRLNQILEAQLRVTLVRNEINDRGQFMRRFYDMCLVRSRSPIFALTWTAIHPIDSDSPLFGLTATDLEDMEAEVVVTLTGIDGTFSQTIHARHSYIPSEIIWNAQFANILIKMPDGRRAIDYNRFHDVI